MADAVIYAWREEQGDVWTGEWALDRKDKWVPAEANKYILATPEALAASPEVAKLIAEAVKAERDRVTRIAASLFPGGYDNNRIKIEDRLSEIATKGATP